MKFSTDYFNPTPQPQPPCVGQTLIFRTKVTYHPSSSSTDLPGTLVLTVRAQGSAAETILYGIELPSAAAGVFVADLNSGDITVGPNGTDRLVIRVSHMQQ